MDLSVINTTISTVAGYINQAVNAANYVTTKSMSDITKLTRVEPLTILSKDLINLEYMPDVQQSLLSLFSAYYLQAVSVLTTINNVEVIKVLDRLNPNRDETGWLLAESLESLPSSQLCIESYKYALPGTAALALEEDDNTQQINNISNLSVGKLLHVKISFKGDVITSVQNIDNGSTKNDTTNVAYDKGGSFTSSKGRDTGKDNHIGYNKKGNDPREGYGKGDQYDKSHDKNDLSIHDKNSISGNNSRSDIDNDVTHKTITKNADQSVTIPIAVRLMASVIPNTSITHIVASKNEDRGIVERFHSWRAGRISFIKDLIFCQDLIDEHKKALIGDETDTYQEIVRRVNNAKKFGLLTKNPSLVSASNLFVISEQVAKEIEQKLGGKLSNKRIRDKAFDNTYAMIIVVVDREWERVTFYTRGVAASTDLSIKEIKNASKGKGSDVLDIFRSLQMGSQVSF